MKYLILAAFLIFVISAELSAQNTIYDDSRVSSVHVNIHPDSLSLIMTDVLSDHYFQAMFVFDYGSGRDTLQQVGFRLRGNTSRFSQKKSFKISFNEYVSGRKYQGIKKMNLNGQHNDPTMIREKLFYDSWKNAGMPERRTSFVKLFINDEYYGLYTNLEEFDKEWLERVYGEKSGNLYKCTYPADLVYLGTNQQSYKNIESGSATGGRAYDLQTNENEDDYSDLVELISILNRTADATFVNLIKQKLNVDSFLKAFAIDVATGNWDDYMYNKNNYFLYHRADTDKFEFISYDTDNTFGVDWVNRDWATRNCLDWYTHSQPRPLASKILSVPEFMEKYQRYLDTIARTIIYPNIIFPQIDILKNLITDAAIADSYRTLDYGYTVADFHNGFIATIDDHTPYGIKPFLTKRYTTMLQQLATASSPDKIQSETVIRLFPNPVDDKLVMTISSAAYNRKCQIIDLHGRTVKTFIIPRKTSELTIAANDLLPGVYFLKTSTSGSMIITTKFIKN